MKRRVASLLVAAAACCACVAEALVAPVSGPVVDLGYAKYQGSYNQAHNLHVWKSVRYAAPPVGKLRWQAPQPPPPQNCHGGPVPAVEQAPFCPQSGAFGTPAIYGFNSGPGDEDCLYLNVYAAPNATALPVMVWIHGGGYSVFGATYDPSIWMNTNNNGFILVEIQYRLGAFGYLASSDIKKHGRLNAGLLDQRFALEWVQRHISKFGGDPNRVTIGGESSGAGSVMYQVMANGGKEAHLFNNIIAASPYTPAIHEFNDKVPTGNYNRFAELAGCGNDSQGLKQHLNVFECLVAAETEVLQNASGIVSTTIGSFGSFAFLPVIDGEFIRERPSMQLARGDVSGKRILVGSNGNEGVPLVNPRVATKPQFDNYISTTFPNFNAEDVRQLTKIYQIDKSKPGNQGVRFDTLGDQGQTALTQSGMATGIQQSVFNLAAETLFHCPAQWLAEAFSESGRRAWKYQYSPTPSYHGADLSAYFSEGATTPSKGFRHAFQKLWGNFIIHDSPVISIADATDGMSNATVPIDQQHKGTIHWPEFTVVTPWQMDLNTTGGEVTMKNITEDLRYYVRTGEGIVNTFRLANAWQWEGGRGLRCNFWRAVSPRVPQ